jgi:hypothetical protein
MVNHASNAQSGRGAQASGQAAGTNESGDFVLRLLNRWKWHILATIVGIILIPVCSGLHLSGLNFTISLLLVIPLFFGASFGIIVGVLVGIIGVLIEGAVPGSVISGRLLALLPMGGFLLFGGVGLLAGLSKFRRHIAPTLGSSFRACFLAGIGMLVFFAIPLYRAYQNNPALFRTTSNVHAAEHLGILLVVTVIVSFILLVIYSAIGALFDAS